MNLEAEGYVVRVAYDGDTGLEEARAEDVSLIILDVMLPKMNGFELLKTLRADGLSMPVMMLSARGAEMDKVMGLELGAEDYVTKPFGLAEFLARVKAVLRRAPADSPASTDELAFGRARVDFARYEATAAGEPVHLSPKAFGVLRLLWERQGRAVSRSEILQQVWGYDAFPTTRTVDNHIAELRAALEPEPAQPRYLLTVHGVGYRFVAPGSGDPRRRDQKTTAS